MATPSDPWISSLIPLLEKLSSFKQCDDQYSLAGSPTPESLNSFLESARVINTFMVIGLHDAPKISRATLLRISRELKGEPLFPSLKYLKIEIHNSSCLDHLPLLISPSLQYVHLKRVHMDSSEDPLPDLKLATNAFIFDLTSQPTYPSITTLIMDNYPQIPVSWLHPLCDLPSLRVLKLAHLSDVRSISDLAPLKVLKALESLSLKLARDKNNTVSYYHSGNRVRTTSGSLKELKLNAPLGLISDFLPVYLEAPLANIELNSATWPASHTHHNRYVLRSLQLFLPDSARNIHITSDPDTYHTLRYPQGIESLYIHGGKESDSSFSHSISYNRTNLNSLYISSINFTLKELASILRSAPCLKDAALLLEICQPPENPTYLPNHPLKKLTILKPAPATAGLVVESSPAATSPEPTPMFLTKVARFLDLLAPSLETLTAEGGDKTWDSLFRIIKLCQEVRSISGTGVEARACVF